MELLASRYPEYADRISGSLSDGGYPEKPRVRDQARRRTTVVTYNPNHNRSLEYDDSGTMSDIELSSHSFQRGGFGRTSLPIVRSMSSSFERPLGLVFLVYGDETKRAVLPNEITTLDTVRALFVRSFPERLTMEYLESPKRKIYLLEPKTNIYFQLEELRDIQDRSVLKVHECDSDKPQFVKDIPPIRSRAVQQGVRPTARPSSRASNSSPFRDEASRSQSLPAKPPHVYQQLMEDQRAQWEVQRRSRSQTPEPDRPNSLPVQARPRYSPDRQPTPERGPLGPIPEHYQLHNGYPPNAGYPSGNEGPPGNYDPMHGYGRNPHAASPVGHYPPGRTFSPPPAMAHYENVYTGYPGHPPGAPPNTYMVRSVRASSVLAPQHATAPPGEIRNGSRGAASNRHSLAFAPMTSPLQSEPLTQRSQSYRVTPERETTPQRSRSTTPQPMDPNTRHRIDKMEAQLANLTAWVHSSVTSPTAPTAGRTDSLDRRSSSSAISDSTDSTFPGSSASSMSDIPSASSPPGQGSYMMPAVTLEMKQRLRGIRAATKELRSELRNLRRMQQANSETMNDSLRLTISSITKVLSTVPGTNNLPLRHKRGDVDFLFQTYCSEKEKIEKELGDLEASVEELRADVISRQCRVNMTDVEGMALILSNITKALAELKARFPKIQEEIKSVMEGEMEIVVSEERFLKEEPEKIEGALKRCKKLTGTLYTLKRLASVQEHRPIQVPEIASNNSEPDHETKKALLENIRAVVPNHDDRVQRLEAADASRERKKKITTQQEALKFGKSLELASKALKSSEFDANKETTAEGNKQAAKFDAQRRVSLPLTDTTEKISNVSTKSADTRTSSLGSGVSLSLSSKQPAPVMSGSAFSSSASTSAVPLKSGETGREELASQKNAARAAFFSSLGTPPTSPTFQSSSHNSPTTPPPRTATTMDYTVRISPVRVTSPSSSGVVTHSTYTVMSTAQSKPQTAPKPSSLIVGSKSSPATSPISPKSGDSSPTRSRLSSIPRPSGTSPSSTSSHTLHSVTSSSDGKPKKVPPPPPPRKSSRLPLTGVGSFSTTASVNGSASGSHSMDKNLVQNSNDTDKGDKKTKDMSTVHKSVNSVQPASSTPKPITARKPITRFEKDLVAGVCANMNRPDLQNQKVPPESVISKVGQATDEVTHKSAEGGDGKGVDQAQGDVTNKCVDSVTSSRDEIVRRREERGSSSDSTSSSTSLDSQQEVVLRRPATKSGSGVTLVGKKPKPEPPERRSSLLGKPDTTSGQSSSQKSSQMSVTQKLQQQSIKLAELEKQQAQIKHTQQMMASGRHSQTIPSSTGINGVSKEKVRQSYGETEIN